MAFHEDLDDDDEEEGGFLASYSDLMTDLLAIFVVLFAFAMINQAYTNANLKEKEKIAENASQNVLYETSEDTSSESSNIAITELNDSQTEEPNKFDRIYEEIKKEIENSGYADSVFIEKTKNSINFRFDESVLFYPDSAEMLESSYNILKYIGDVLSKVDPDIISYEISGHTAKTSGDNTSVLHWTLSCNRSITVLNFLTKECKLDESKMIISGYSYYKSVTENNDEEGRKQNRRVEIKITYQN